MYRSQPCLWRVKSEDYFNGAARQKAWEHLVRFSKKINPCADISWVKKKVHTMRGSFRKEIKKVEASSKSGAGRQELYKPKLWYYEHLMFTKNQENPRQFSSNAEDRDEDMVKDSSIPHVECAMPGGNSTIATEMETAKKRKNEREDQQSDDLQTSLLRKANLLLDSQDDEYDSHGKTIAAKLRRIASANYDQFLLADKLLNEVLFKALKNQLTVNSTITNTNTTETTVHPLDTVPHDQYGNATPQSPPFRGWPEQHNPLESLTESSLTSMSAGQSPASPTPSTTPDVENT